MESAASAAPDVRYLVDEEGRPTAAVVDIRVWERLIRRIEDDEDARLARDRLAGWRTKEGWLAWEEFEAELDQA